MRPFNCPAKFGGCDKAECAIFGCQLDTQGRALSNVLSKKEFLALLERKLPTKDALIVWETLERNNYMITRE